MHVCGSDVGLNAQYKKNSLFLTAAVKHKVLRRDTETKAPPGAEFRLVSGLVFYYYP